jgi:hypothetical protein
VNEEGLCGGSGEPPYRITTKFQYRVLVIMLLGLV